MNLWTALKQYVYFHSSFVENNFGLDTKCDIVKITAFYPKCEVVDKFPIHITCTVELTLGLLLLFHDM